MSLHAWLSRFRQSVIGPAKLRTPARGPTRARRSFVLRVESLEDRTLLSSDLGQIAFTSRRDGNFEIYVMDAEPGAIATNLTNNAADDFWPKWSPDGTKIAFTRLIGGGDIFVMNADGSNQTNLTIIWWKISIRPGLPMAPRLRSRAFHLIPAYRYLRHGR